jgi:hypothetical protein
MSYDASNEPPPENPEHGSHHEFRISVTVNVARDGTVTVRVSDREESKTRLGSPAPDAEHPPGEFKTAADVAQSRSQSPSPPSPDTGWPPGITVTINMTGWPPGK